MPDAMDEQIRALVARVVAQAPPPPSAAEVDASTTVAPEPAPRSGGARAVLAAAGAVAAVALAVVGALAVRNPNREPGTATDRDGTPFDANAVRFVPTELPLGMRLSTVEDSVSAIVDRVPAPQVSVFEGSNGVRVRIVVDPFGSGTAATATTGSVPSDTSSPVSTSTVPASPTSTAQARPTGTSVTTGTTMPATGPPGLPVRSGMETTEVRGGIGGLEVHDASTTTVWFLHQGIVVAVDVFGLDSTAALRIANGLTPRSGGGFDPAPQEPLVSVAEVASGSANDPLPATTKLVYATGDSAGSSVFVVTTMGLEPRRSDLLTAAASSFGRLQRWGDREVLVEQHEVVSPGVSAASFVTPAGELVTVQAPASADLRSHVDGLRAADRRSWEQLVSEEGDRVAELPVRTSVDVGPAAITERRPNGPDGREQAQSPGGYCLEVDGTTACRPRTTDDLTSGGRDSTVHVLLDGHWWYFGQLTDEVALLEVAPDRGGPAEIHRVGRDGSTWFAVRLPDAATSASVQFGISGGERSEGQAARPAS